LLDGGFDLAIRLSAPIQNGNRVAANRFFQPATLRFTG
jgi:hypothetical protein